VEECQNIFLVFFRDGPFLECSKRLELVTQLCPLWEEDQLLITPDFDSVKIAEKEPCLNLSVLSEMDRSFWTRDWLFTDSRLSGTEDAPEPAPGRVNPRF
jgi:hypothetical protein